MRFQVSEVMDAIEQRLTTDITGAQAVVDVGAVVRQVEFDRGRGVNLVRIGMVVDALGRYLVDGGAMLYGVAERALLSEQAFTSKERMVLGRWAGDGLIEIASSAADRVVEIADMTGLPLIALEPRPELLERYGWLADPAGRVLRIGHRAGTVVLSPIGDPLTGPAAGEPAEPVPAGSVVGRAAVVVKPAAAGAGAEVADAEVPDAGVADAGVADAEDAPDVGVADAEDAEDAPDVGVADAEDAQDAPDAGVADVAVVDSSVADGGAAVYDRSGAQERGVEAGVDEPPGDEPSGGEQADDQADDQAASVAMAVPVQVFGARGAAPTTRTRISWHRFLQPEPQPAYDRVLGREWRCQSFDCPAFGEHRLIGQPAPRLRDQVPICPRHDEPMEELGPRPPAYPVSIVVDDLPRRRVVVRGGRPQPVGRADTDPEVLSVAQWLHGAAAAWISPVHLQLAAGADGLTVTDLSTNGTMVWQRKGPDDPGTARPLHGESYLLEEWDSVELYTGIELMRGDRRIAGVLGRDELDSVLRDAPTAAYHQVDAG